MEGYKIGSYILNKRKELNITQEELAKKLGVSSKTVSKWECGFMIPNCENVDKLCNVFGVSVSELINGGKSKSVLTDEESKMLLASSRNQLFNGSVFSIMNLFLSLFIFFITILNSFILMKQIDTLEYNEISSTIFSTANVILICFAVIIVFISIIFLLNRKNKDFFK